jgi:hypothetical protein
MRPTSEAPGARITARKSATPFVQAALAKGGVVTEIAKQAAEYSNMRYKMLVETQKNEAIFSAKEALNELSRTLEKSEDIGNIFDGEMKYDQGVEGVYNEMRAKVGKNRYALQDFENSFRQMEIPIKFRLKEVVDIKIEKRRQAALKALEDQQVNTLSDPYLDYTSDDLILSQAGLQSIHDQAVATGGVNPNIMGNVSERVLLKAAKNVVPAYAGRDLDRAMQLLDVYDQLDRVRAGEIEASEMAISGEIPNHVLNMLQTLPPDEATAILGNTLKSAAAFFNVQEKIDDEVIETQNQRNTKAYNFALSVDIGEDVSPFTMQQILSPSDFATFTETYGDRSISGLEAKKFIEDALNDQFWMDRTQQEALRSELDIAGEIKFAPAGKGSEAVYSKLVALAEAGELRVSELNANSSQITAAQNRELTMKIFNEGDEALNEASKIIKRSFRYNELDAAQDNPKLARASKTAFEAADAELLLEYMERQSAGNPMTRTELRVFALDQVEKFQSIYAEALREEYEQDIAQFSDPHPGLSIDPADPIGSIDRWYGSLSETAQQTKRNAYAVMKARIKAKYANTGLY